MNTLTANPSIKIEFPSFIPKSIDYVKTPNVFKGITPTMQEHYEELIYNGWSFYAVDMKQADGLCYACGVITVSAAFLNRATEMQRLWLLSHEMSHAFAGQRAKHGYSFMQWLKRICPSDCIHLELNYKPRNAALAGIMPEGF